MSTLKFIALLILLMIAFVGAFWLYCAGLAKKPNLPIPAISQVRAMSDRA